MKWLLAASQVLLLVVLQWRRWTITLPGLRAFLGFAILSSVFYDPWNVSRFEWFSIPSVALRIWVLFECFHLLTRGRFAPLRSLMLVAECIGGIGLLGLSWVAVERYSPGITLAIYCAEVLAGAFGVMLGIVWIMIGWPKDWRKFYALLVGVYFWVLAIARISTSWEYANNISMALYIGIFVLLAKHFSQHRHKLFQRDSAEHY